MTYRPKPPGTGPGSKTGKEPSLSQGGVPKPPKIVLGDELEYRIARLQVFMGYFVRRGCPIYTIGGLDQATDLDVLAIRYIEPFQRQMLITECKGGLDGPLDRIFWLSGVKRFVEADEAILVRKGTRWNIKDFAKNAGVQIFDLARIAELEAKFNITEAEWPGVSDRSFFAATINDWNRTLSLNPKLWEFYWTVLGEIRYEEPFAAVNYLLQQLRILTKSAGKALLSPSLERKLLVDAISQLALFLIQIAGGAFDLSEKDRKGFVVKGLTYGNLDPRSSERVLNSAYNLTRQAILHYTQKSYDIDKKLFEMPTPPGTEEVLDIIRLIVNHYPASLTLPQICDLLLTEGFVKNQGGKAWLTRIFPYSDLTTRVDIVTSFLQSLVKAGACPREALDSLAELSPEEKTSPVDGRPAESMRGGDRLDSSANAVGLTPQTGDKKSEVAEKSENPMDTGENFKLEPPPTSSHKLS